MISVLVYFVLGYFFLRGTETKNIEATEANIFLGPLLLVSLISLFFSFLLRKRFFVRAANEQRADMIQTGVIIGFALCEAAAILGLVAIFLTGNALSFVILAVAATGILLHFPRREQLLGAYFKHVG
jgi:hypothetical protein